MELILCTPVGSSTMRRNKSLLVSTYHLNSVTFFNDRLEEIAKVVEEDFTDQVGRCFLRYYARPMYISSKKMGLHYEKIHACHYDCVLFRNEYTSLNKCPNSSCGEPSYKRDKVSSKVV
ncbi:hypothetical protein V2J09_005898 [Rumex salicifolius]